MSPWLILAWCCASLTVLVEPAFYQRIFAARDAVQVRRALLVGIVLWAAYDFGATLIGLLARAAVASNLLPADLPGRQALMAICLKTLPLGLKGLFIAGVLAAAMSSVDSYGLLASGNLVYDIYRPLARRPPSDERMVLLTRVGVLVVLGAGALASLAFKRIGDAWVFMASVLASVVLVPLLGALLGRPRPAAGLAGSLAGLLALFAFYLAIHVGGRYHDGEGSYVWQLGKVQLWREYAVLFALPVSALAFALGHLAGRAPPREAP